MRVGSVSSGPVSETTALRNEDVEQRLTATEALIEGVLDGSTLVGEMPPQPPTLRARIGRIPVSIVRRAVFWLSHQIRDFQMAVMASQREHAHLLRAQGAALRAHSEQMLKLQQALEAVRTKQENAIQDVLDQVEELKKDLGARIEELKKDVLVRFEAVRTKQENAIQDVQVQVEELKKAVLVRVGELQTQIREQQAQASQLQSGSRQVDSYLHQTRMQTALLERRLTTLFEEARRSAAQMLADAESHGQDTAAAPLITDPLYVEFENRFRGDRADIKQRFEYYIPRLKNSRLGHPEMAVLDLGCGRGEWLELLRDEGLEGSGVDMNPVMIEECRSRGLSVALRDAIAYLRALPAGSQGVVTGFHIVEHLPLSHLLALLDETNRVLKTGGMAIFETPNPSNLQVSMENFYLDPTHRNPLPKALLAFLMEARGLCDIEVLPLHAYPESYRIVDDGQPATRLLNQLMFSEQDYAVIGRKA